MQVKLNSFHEFVNENLPQDVKDSFDLKDELNPKLWKDHKLKPEIRDRLMIIADDFISTLKLPEGISPKDITLTGSISNYNWSKFSDVDLHVRLDFSEIGNDTEFIKNSFMAKKSVWNQKHDIDIFGFPVEVYVENVGDTHIASGLYSVMNDKWIHEPPEQHVVIDKDDIESKAEGYLAHIPHLEKLMDEKKYQEVIDMIAKIKERLMNMRKSGLEKGGELSVENLAFKALRRTSFIGTINNMKTEAYDKSISMENKQ